MTLTEKVYVLLSRETGHDLPGPVGAVGRFPNHPEGECLTSFEQDCRDWGLAFGIAYGIARSEDAFESEDAVAARALVAARDAFGRWGGGDIFTTEAYDEDRAERPREIETVA
jgi:hypothetical protein